MRAVGYMVQHMAYTLDRRTVLSKAAAHDLTITQLAELAGIHRVTLASALSRTAPTSPTVNTLFSLAEALATPAEELIVKVS